MPLPQNTDPPIEDHAIERPDGSNVWKAAYERLKADSPDLVTPYEYLIERSAPGSQDVQRTFSVIVADNLKALESKQWKLKFRGKPVDVRGVLDDILKLIKVAMPVASAAGILDPVHAGLPLAGVQVLLDVSILGFSLTHAFEPLLLSGSSGIVSHWQLFVS